MFLQASLDSDSAHESFGYTVNILIRNYTAKQKKGYQIVNGHDLTKMQLCAG